MLFVCVFFSLFFFGFWNEFSSGRLELKGSVCVCVFFLFFFFGFADACFYNKRRDRLQRESRGHFGVVYEWVVVLQVVVLQVG